jgi:hypothetical protein
LKEARWMNAKGGGDAEDIATAALGFIAGDPTLLRRFLDLTGIEPSGIRRAAGEPGFLAGVLRFVTAHEPTLMAFAEAEGIDPARIAAAARNLPGGDERYEMTT